MKGLFKYGKYALAGAGLLAVGAGPAYAGALATSVLSMSNFLFTNSSHATLNYLTDFQAITSSGTAQMSAAYNNPTGVTVNGGPAVAGQIDLPPLCQGSCPAIANDAFPILTAPPTGNFSAADQLEFGAPISNIPTHLAPPAPATIPAGATIASASYTNLAFAAPGPNNASSRNDLNASAIFTAGFTDTVTMSFVASLYQESFTSNDQIFPAGAQTSTALTITLNQIGAGGATVGSLVWTPNGNGSTDYQATGTFVSYSGTSTDAFNLNGGTTTSAPYPFTGQHLLPGEAAGTPMVGNFAITTPTLVAGTQYQILASLKTSASAVSTPEPAPLVLLGGGLLVVGLARKMRNRRRLS